MEYIMFDVDKIKEFVFDSFKPKEVAGASELIKALDHDPKSKVDEQLLAELKREFKDIEVVYSKGGGGLLYTDNGNGEKICEWLEDKYHKHVKEGGRLTAVSQPKGDFQTTFAILNYKLRQKKSEKCLDRPLESVEFEEKNDKCGTCGKRRAVTELEMKDGEKIPYCDVCLHKRTFLKDEKDEFGAETLEDIIKLDKEKYPWLKKVKDTKDMLVIYGDLNEAGTHISNLKSEAELQRFSDVVFDILNQTRQRIKSRLIKEGFRYLMPVVGGDDIIIFSHPVTFGMIQDELLKVEADLKKDLKNPEGNNKIKIELEKDVRMNFSFLVAKHNFPIYHLFKISEELLNKTKERYYQKEPKDTYYGFFWLKEGGHRLEEEDVYLKTDFVSLFETAKKIHKNPKIHRSALYQVLNFISDDSSELEPHLNMQYFLARHQEFNDIISWLDFTSWIHVGDEKRELTPAILEDIINMIDLLYEHEPEEEVKQ